MIAGAFKFIGYWRAGVILGWNDVVGVNPEAFGLNALKPDAPVGLNALAAIFILKNAN